MNKLWRLSIDLPLQESVHNFWLKKPTLTIQDANS